MLDLPKKVLLPKGINPPRRHSELTIAIIQLVASKRGIAALPYWTVMPYLEKGYVVHRQITANGLQSELYGRHAHRRRRQKLSRTTSAKRPRTQLRRSPRLE